MKKETSIKLFEERKVRTVWDEEKEEWYFSVVDVINVLTESPNPRNYWKVLKHRLIIIVCGVFLFASCSVRNVTYNRDKILTKYNNYTVFLNSKQINIDTLYLDKNNVKTVKIKKLEKHIYIMQKNTKVEYFSPRDASLTQNQNFENVIINGELADTIRIKQIEIGAIKNIEILVKEEDRIFNHRKPGTGSLIITLK